MITKGCYPGNVNCGTISQMLLKSETMIFGLVWILIPLMIITQLEGKLLGDHICQNEITVPEEILKWELTNRTTRTYQWCMSVPPRCSVYSNKLVNETRISVINVTQLIEACCDGFIKQNNYCVSQCHNCQNGLCIKGTCVCQKGWNGQQCDSRTASTFIKPSTSTSEEFLTQKSITVPFSEENVKTTSTIAYQSSEEVNSLDNKHPSSTFSYNPNSMTTRSSWDDHNNPLEIYSTSPTSATKISTNFPENNSAIDHPILKQMLNLYNIAYLSTTTEVPATDLTSSEDLEGSGSRYRSKIEKYSTESSNFDTTTTQQTYSSSTGFVEMDESFDSNENTYNENVSSFEQVPSNVEREDSVIDYRELDRTIYEESDLRLPTTVKSTAVLTKPSTIEEFKNENSILKENYLKGLDDFVGERYEKRSSMENLGQNSQNTKLTITEPASKHLIYSICAASLTTFLILVIVVTLYAVRNSRKKVEKNKAKKDIATVAVYTTSIFHSPLPDPPMFDNPTYLATGSTNRDSNEEKRETIEIQQFNVVLQKPIQNPKLDCIQYVYDHPPSTGSYRASSDVDTLSHYNFSQRSLSGVVSEPLYDEIPSKDITVKEVLGVDQNFSGHVDPNCLYMNTCARTKF